MIRRFGVLLYALVASFAIVAFRLSWAPSWVRADALVVGACLAVAFSAFIVGFAVTTRCLEAMFGRVDDVNA